MMRGMVEDDRQHLLMAATMKVPRRDETGITGKTDNELLMTSR